MALSNQSTSSDSKKYAFLVGLSGILSIITLSLLYGGLPFFGPINDLITAAGGILSGLMASSFYKQLPATKNQRGNIFILIAWLGVISIAGNAVLVAFGQLNWIIGGGFTAFGFGLIGIWLFTFLRQPDSQAIFSSKMRNIGFLASSTLLAGIVAGPLMVFASDLSTSPIAWISMIATGIGWITYHIWCFLFGRR